MIKKTITYEDYEGNRRTEDFYFNLSRAELISMNYSVSGGMAKKLEFISKSEDPTLIMPVFKDLILKSYGIKSEDGKRFMKSDEISAAFEQSEAFSELLVDLMTNPDKAADFVNGLINAKQFANIEALPKPEEAH